jgi:excinuclease ABC subunit B
VIAHNKTLAAQLAQEYKEFFPDAAVHYFVSYYDFYQPEAYMPISDTYIEKEAHTNAEIDRLRHASTQAILTRPDTIIVASVSCIYGLGSPEEYEKVNMKLKVGQNISRKELLRALVQVHYERTGADLSPGQFRALGAAVEIMPKGEKNLYRLEFRGDTIATIQKIDAISRRIISDEHAVFLFPAKHFITPEAERARATAAIKEELAEQLKKFEKEGKVLEAERLRRRTRYDLAMIQEVGYCNGIENYSRHFAGKLPGEPPDTLLSYFKKQGDFLTIIDESHVTIPQIRGMYEGDRARKETLIEHGFRLPSAKDNRPLRFEEFEARVGQVLFTSATPGEYEMEKSKTPVEQIIRPTGLLDPEVEVREVNERGTYPGQIQNFIAEAEKAIAKRGRVIATTLTKRMAEDLSSFLKDKGIKAEYLHSDIETLPRIEILTKFRKGEFDCIVGVNLLREGLDLPEVTLIGILDADREGFLRSETSLIQIIGRAARNAAGRVVLYADTITQSMKRAMDETNRRRGLQMAHNREHGITPQTIIKKVRDITESLGLEHERAVAELVRVDREALTHKKLPVLIKEKQKQMNAAVKILDFESAALLRDEIRALEQLRRGT